MTGVASLSSLSTGAIIGIIFAIFFGLTLVVAFILGCVLWRLRCKGRRVDAQEKEEKEEARKLEEAQERANGKAQAPSPPPSHPLPQLPTQAYVQAQPFQSQQPQAPRQSQQFVMVPAMHQEQYETAQTMPHNTTQQRISQMYGYNAVA
ncbi:hypothetical protein GGI23_004557 [Coemansia sp. RSA 2559]|nr:hypothetical protein GGI23_004557 [Coemansia sp. RSA 2559]